MPVFQFIANNNDNPISYYATTNNVGNYTRNIRCEWNKKYKKLNETTPQYNIYGLIGGAFGDWEVVEISCVLTDGPASTDTEMTTKELLKFFIKNDKKCLNKNKHCFEKTEYHKSYYKKKKTFRDLSPTNKLREYGLI